ncbi:3'-5' exonuclease [Halalkalibacter akibai]|uniref:Exonuclease family protein n=1 Tax=Halalkalibacter akibai (strain ATCC 43226 / DSM 21942 / CIP 109018 / JCM 9157 / 1139) TaxID=1236973 RepID=W4QV09_HALA3|nr:3'-5' exonuclease [Halalkalibacter akibai]GAE35970.1 exonuclease family protein [Halalkalibacter akibai JCM 9157]
MDFVALDFETANTNRSSVCSIGIVVVKNGNVADEYYQLIKPRDMYFDPLCVRIHGITPEDVKDSPSFSEVWKDISPLLEGNLVIAHNASFDMSVLRYSLDECQLDYPSFSYNCTVNVSKKTWLGLPSYSLNVVARHLQIEFKHHHALEDAQVAAQVYLQACKYNKVTSHVELIEKLEIGQGTIYANGYTPARANKKKSKTKRSTLSMN